jgi:sirohydrochlorin ferrochelatase
MKTLEFAMEQERTGVVIVDHGSRRSESNAFLLEVAARFADASGFSIVEPAHMELAEPTLETAFDRCVKRGATTIVVHPFFLLPGKHWDEDIPSLAAAAARKHAGVRYLVTAPLGLQPLMLDVMRAQIGHCLAHAQGEAEECAACQGTQKCRFQGG